LIERPLFEALTLMFFCSVFVFAIRMKIFRLHEHIVLNIVCCPSPFLSCPKMLGDTTIKNTHHEEYSSSDFHHVFSVFVFMYTGCTHVILFMSSSSYDADGAHLRRRSTHSFMSGMVLKLLERTCGGCNSFVCLARVRPTRPIKKNITASAPFPP